MPSNGKYVCIPCRTVYGMTSVCPNCRNPMEYVGKRWSPPKKSNNRAWKRIESGEWNWDRRRVRRAGRWGSPFSRPELVPVWETVVVETPHNQIDGSVVMIKRKSRKMTGRLRTNYHQTPGVDLGG